MGADYMLIPLMAAEQFGVNTLARAMAIILPVEHHRADLVPLLRFAAARAFRRLRARAACRCSRCRWSGPLAIALLPQARQTG